MTRMINKTGNVDQWKADIITGEGFTHRVAAWTTEGIQHARVRTTDGEIISEFASEKGCPIPQGDLEDWAVNVAAEQK